MYIFSDMGIPGDSVGKNLPVNSGNARHGFESRVIRQILGEGRGTSLQDSCLENPMDRGAWWATVLGVTESQT